MKFAIHLALVLPVVVVAALMALLIVVRNGAEAAVAGAAVLLPFGWAFAAGMVSSVNPCGFFMLPAYLSYQLGTEEAGFYESSAVKRGMKALSVGLAATSGFVAIMAFVGTIIAAGGRWLVKIFPYAGVTIGASLAALGLWLLITGQTLGIPAPGRVTVTPQRNLRNVFLCALPYCA